VATPGSSGSGHSRPPCTAVAALPADHVARVGRLACFMLHVRWLARLSYMSLPGPLIVDRLVQGLRTGPVLPLSESVPDAAPDADGTPTKAAASASESFPCHPLLAPTLPSTGTQTPLMEATSSKRERTIAGTCAPSLTALASVVLPVAPHRRPGHAPGVDRPKPAATPRRSWSSRKGAHQRPRHGSRHPPCGCQDLCATSCDLLVLVSQPAERSPRRTPWASVVARSGRGRRGAAC
jgi:hypothetical protein